MKNKNDSTFWHVNIYNKKDKKKINNFITYGEWSYIVKKLMKKNINYIITVTSPKLEDFKNFKDIESF